MALKGSSAAAPDALDELRKRDIPADGIAAGPIRSFDPLSFYVGRVMKTYSAEAGKSYQRDLSAFIDRSKKIVRSINKQLAWDYNVGLIRINAARSQGTAGFLSKAGPVEL